MSECGGRSRCRPDAELAGLTSPRCVSSSSSAPPIVADCGPTRRGGAGSGCVWRESGLDGLSEQDGDCHWADAAGHWRDQLGAVRCSVVFDVADVAGVVASVDDDGTWLDPFALDEFRLADCGNDDVGAANRLGEAGGLGVAERDGRVARAGACRRAYRGLDCDR